MQRFSFFPDPNQLVLTRDILFSSLINELTLNKILLQNYFSEKPIISASTNSRPEQPESIIQEEVMMPQQEEEMEEKIIDEKNTLISNMKNDTKNIPKNYGKAILTFIQKWPKSRQLAKQMGVNYPDLIMYVKRFRKKVNSIDGLKKMWGAGNLNHKVKRCIRILSYLFMRKHCLQYIFHSKVRNLGTHIKYRKKLIEGIENPNMFNHIKDY